MSDGGNHVSPPNIDVRNVPPQSSSDASVPQESAVVNQTDPLLQILTGGRRVEQSTLTNDQFAALVCTKIWKFPDRFMELFGRRSGLAGCPLNSGPALSPGEGLRHEGQHEDGLFP